MLIQWYTYVNSFHQLSYFEFAVYFEWDEKLRTYEIGNESKLQVEITFNQSIMLGHPISKSNIILCLKVISTCHLLSLPSWGHMK